MERKVSSLSQNQKIQLVDNEGSIQTLRLNYDSSDESVDISSNPIDLVYEFQAYVPDAFTPNNDGLNDRFRIFGLTDEEVKFKIYNRWGELIKLSNDPNNLWNGQINGEDAPVGKYFYLLEFESIEGNIIQQQGSFVLIRN